MISSINSGMSMLPLQSSSSTKSLTDEQLTLITDTFSELDADNLTQEDAVSIVEKLSEAGIEPGKEMESALAEVGFDAKEIGDLANVEESGKGERPPPPPPPSESQSSTEISDMVSFLEELLEEKLASSTDTELNDQDKEAIYAKVMEQFGIEEGESIINTTV